MDLILYHPPNPSRSLDSSVIKRLEVLIRNQISDSRLIKDEQMTSEQMKIEIRGIRPIYLPLCRIFFPLLISAALGAALTVQPIFIPVLELGLEQIRRAHLAKRQILTLQKIPFDSNNLQHIQVCWVGRWIALETVILEFYQSLIDRHWSVCGTY